MIFTYKKWDAFCAHLINKGIKSIPAKNVSQQQTEYLVLKHDVETDVRKAYRMASIENYHGHCGSYYIQAYLLEKSENVSLLQKMKEMGHEISYHYDVMDSNKGDIEKAMEEFRKNKELFEKYGFKLNTVCQHGNPIVDRIGYSSNRDFFRNTSVKKMYPEISDIMVDFKKLKKTDYLYFSDAGRRFKMIYDPINNDLVDSSEQDIAFNSLAELLTQIEGDGRFIISTHPHRWTESAVLYLMKMTIFKMIRFMAKTLVRVPIFKRWMSKYYYLAKKI